MIGLLKNNFYAVIENIKLIFMLVLLLGVITFITGNANLINIFSLFSTPTISILTFLCLRKECSSKWNKYKLCMPVKKSDIVKSQYFSHILWSCIGVITVSIFLAITIAIHGNKYFYYGFRDAITLILGGGIISLLIGSISYPLYYVLDYEKTEAIAIISTVISLVFIIGISILINIFFGCGNVSDIQYYTSLFVILILTFIILLTSYKIAVSIYSKKEY